MDYPLYLCGPHYDYSRISDSANMSKSDGELMVRNLEYFVAVKVC